jgi:hypothetical protein
VRFEPLAHDDPGILPPAPSVEIGLDARRQHDDCDHRGAGDGDEVTDPRANPGSLDEPFAGPIEGTRRRQTQEGQDRERVPEGLVRVGQERGQEDSREREPCEGHRSRLRGAEQRRQAE